MRFYIATDSFGWLVFRIYVGDIEIMYMEKDEEPIGFSPFPEAYVNKVGYTLITESDVPEDVMKGIRKFIDSPFLQLDWEKFLHVD